MGIRHLAHVLTVPPNKSAPTLRYTRRHGPVYTGHACMHLPRAVPWISEDRLLLSASHRLSGSCFLTLGPSYTAWVAISKHGILGPLWFEDENGQSVIVNIELTN